MQLLIEHDQLPELTYSPWQLWLRWVAANALGELLGLGLAAAVSVAVMLRFGEPTSAVAILAVAALMILLGVSEGVIVGFAQWRVLRQVLATLTAKAWMGATALGAFIAWLLGMLPSTMINLSARGTSRAPPVLSDALMFGLAALMGAGLGIILALPQWRVLRHQLSHAAWWLPANALAWAAGMPVIFIGAGAMPTTGVNWLVILFIALTLVVAGAVVGALHGFALVWLLSSQRRES